MALLRNLHASHQPEVRRALRVLAALAAIVVLVHLFAADIRGVIAPFHLSLHTLFESISVLVSGLVFSVGWYAHRRGTAGNLVLLACGFLAVGMLDFAHTLSYPGMPDFFGANSVGKAIEFWLLARLAAVATLLAAIALPWRAWTTAPGRWQLPVVVASAVVLLVAHISHRPGWIPDTFVEGRGLTAFKIGFEYLLVALSLATAVLLWRRMRAPLPYRAADLFSAVCITALSESIFTLYLSASDVLNLLGHIYKIIAYAYLYRAIFVETVRAPYEQLDEAHRQLEALLGAVPDLMFEIDGRGRFHFVHAHRPELLAAPAEQLLGRELAEVLPAAAVATCEMAFAEARAKGWSHGRRIRLDLAIGRAWFELSVAAKPTGRDGGPHFIVLSRDISERARDEQALRLLRQAVDQSPSVILVTDLHGTIEYANPALTQTSGYPLHEVIGRNPRMFKSGKTPAATYQAMWSQLLLGRIWRGEFVNRRKDGSEYTEIAFASPVVDDEGNISHLLSIQNDVTHLRQAESRIDQLSNFDVLTGLPNRAAFAARLQQAIHRASRGNASLAMLLIDLDHFKHINDTLGFGSGDAVLQATTERIRAVAGEFALLSRHGSDEFILMLPEADSTSAAQTATQLLEAIRPPVRLDDRELVVTASIGVALFPADAGNAEQLMQHVDVALHRAKQAGRDRFEFFSAELQTRSARVLQLENALRNAIDRDQLALVYQPQWRLRDQALIGMEALLRWTHPELGPVSPAEFIPIAEHSGQIVGIGEWVIRNAIAQVRAWREQGLQPPRVAVNLSIAQFRDRNLANFLRIQLAQAELPAQSVELELTESIAMEDAEQAVALMHGLHAQGIRLSIDDFGTGYSSLSYLKRFPCYKLKIDQSFVRNITEDANDRSIVAAIIAMARSLDMLTLAEGVETSEQLAALRELGCQEAQGYLFSRPLAVAAMESLLVHPAAASPQPR